MNKFLVHLTASLLALHLLAACDSPSGLVTRRSEQALVTVRANIQPGATLQSASIVQIPDPTQLPEPLRTASQLSVIFDSSGSTVKVQRNADGSLSFPLLTGRSFGSGSTLNLLMVGDNGVSYPIQLQTGTPLVLASPPLAASPGSTVTLGTRLQLQARLADSSQADNFVFSWEVAPSAAGPWQNLSGSSTAVEWEPRQAGAYYVRLGITDTRTRSSSSYLSPTPQVYVQEPERLAQTTPASGSIVSGEEITLKAALPEFKDNQDPALQWFYALTAQGPFAPIAARGTQISWEPPAAGAYFLRLQSARDGRLSTYTSVRPEVQVAAPDEVIVTDPVSGSLVRGQSITLSTTLPPLSDQASYTWFYSFSPAGPFTPLAVERSSDPEGTGHSVKWTPPLTGEFYLRLRSFDPVSGQSRTYTSAKTEVSVRDSNTAFTTSPDPASLRRGDTVSVTLDEAPSEQVIWSYGASLQGVFLPIPDTGKTITWTPAEAGSFYLRATATRADGSTASFTSADPLVFVAERSGVIQASPANGSLELGQPATLHADISDPGSAQRYAWSYSSSPTGPFVPVQTLESSALQTVTWYPPTAGSFFVRVEVSNPSTQSSVSFTSSEPAVRVSETRPFFTTDPANGLIEPDDNVRLFAAFDPGIRTFNFGWAYSRSTAGPFTPIGGSSGPEVLWDDEAKPEGSYYVRLQATAPGSDRSLTFVSSYPVLFIDKDAEKSGNEFGAAGPSTSTSASGFPF